MLEIGSLIDGKYKILNKVGQGGMSIVYLAMNEKANKQWATLAKECDWMYGMLRQHSYPGYLYMLDNGATGTWEHWNASRSRLHNCFNGIGSWFYQALGGIIPDAPGYRHILLDPQMPEGLESVSVTKETPYGTIVVRREGKNLHFELPVGVTASLRGEEYSCGSYDVVL